MKPYMEIVIGLSRRHKTTILLLSDIVAFNLSLVPLLNLNPINKVGINLINELLFASFSTLIPISLLLVTGVFRTSIRFFSSALKFKLLTVSTLTAFFLLVPINLFDRTFHQYQLVAFAISFFFLMLGCRVLARAYLSPTPLVDKHIENVAIYSVSHRSRQLLSEVKATTQFRATYFIEQTETLTGVDVDGLRVLSIEKFLSTIEKHETKIVLVAIENTTNASLAELLQKFDGYSITVKVIPSLPDLILQKGAPAPLRNLTIDDLIGRPAHKPIEHLLKKDVFGKVIMVTGAGGTIGSELCKQAIKNGAKKLLLVDISEVGLYQITRKLEKMSQRDVYNTAIQPILCSISEKFALKNLLKAHKVHTVYHAAAYKHVPLLEQNQLKAIKNNAFGTHDLCSASIEAGVSKLIAISSDKAVRSTNIMGASKRLAELICLSKNLTTKKTQISIVRFGNVIGSSGSAIPLFQEQISEGGPLTVTHSDITRYFMTTSEAAQLVIQAGAMASDNSIFVLDMGKPIRIMDLAENMIRLNGLVPIRNSKTKLKVEKNTKAEGHIEIKVIGLRQGEKLHEELFIDGRAEPSEHPKILKAAENVMAKTRLNSMLKTLDKAIKTENIPLALKILATPEIGYQTTNQKKK